MLRQAFPLLRLSDVTRDMELVLSALGDGLPHTTISLARDLGLDTSFIRAALEQLALPGWTAKGKAGPAPHYARQWSITKTGRDVLEKKAPA